MSTSNDAGVATEPTPADAQQIYPEIHLEPSESLVFAQLQASPVLLRIFRYGCVGIAANLVAKLAA